ncbi:aldehyde dehydrogenase family protein [Dactylosporangium sp. NPDC050688]|uniref:aldehyde dehydrogenase family protein n=1 Tax=Dactylosporangium sp. NPDC050688 TaxID=3157217 RepID=UPI0033CA2407
MTLHRIPLVRAGVPASSAETARLDAVDGTPLALVDQAPPLLATLTVADLRRRGPSGTAPDAEVFRRAGELFATAELDGIGPERYCELQARSAGIPISTARRSLADIREVCTHMGERVEAERPPGAGSDVEAGRIEAVWARRGDVLAVIAPGNNPGVHVQWIQGLALGYQLVIRPGSKDPFTPARLVAALLAAGVEPAHLSLLPGGHATADALVRAADLSLVFGSDDAVRAYAGDRTVIPRGPGLSKLLQLGELTEQALDTICTSVGYDAGMRCTNASAVFTDGDPMAVGAAIAARLARLVPGPPLSPEAQLPVMPIGRATAMRAHLDARRAGAVDVAAPLYPDGPVTDLGDGSAAMRPAVLVCDRPDHPGAAIELPFPCVWVLPWDPTEGFAPLRNTLALTILGGDRKLAVEALREPTIRKVLLGPLPTFSAGTTSPHDGFLGHELMEARGYGVAAE